MRKIISFVILCLVLFGSLAISVQGKEIFTVPNLSQINRNVNLSSGDSVTGSISVSGGLGNGINFFVVDPNGNTIVNYDRTTSTSFSFSASTAGNYKMTFDNSFSLLSSKSVTLDYSVHSANILSQNTILIIVSLVVVLILMFVGVAVSKRTRTRHQNTTVNQALLERSIMKYFIVVSIKGRVI